MFLVQGATVAQQYCTKYDIWCHVLFGVTYSYAILLLMSKFQVNISMFYNVQTTNSTFVGKKIRCVANNYSNA